MTYNLDKLKTVLESTSVTEDYQPSIEVVTTSQDAFLKYQAPTGLELRFFDDGQTAFHVFLWEGIAEQGQEYGALTTSEAHEFCTILMQNAYNWQRDRKDWIFALLSQQGPKQKFYLEFHATLAGKIIEIRRAKDARLIEKTTLKNLHAPFLAAWYL